MVKKWAYYNEWDKGAAEWLRQLIKLGAIMDGEVDERSITDVCADDVRGFVRQHWFAGVGGWDLALQRVGWPVDKPVVSASCPCQPYSCAGKGLAHKDERDLWPVMFAILREGRPETILGEQVASAEVVGNELEASFALAVQRGDYAAANGLAHRLARSPSLGYQKRWLDRLRSDLEGEGYTVRNPVLGAHSAGADHQRQRLYWAAERGRLADTPVIGRESQPDGRAAAVLGEMSGEAERVAAVRAHRTGPRRLADALRGGGGASRTAGEYGSRGTDGSGGSGEPRGLAHTEGGGFGTDGRAPGLAGHPAQRDAARKLGHSEGDDERRNADGTHGQGVAPGGSGGAGGMDDAERDRRRAWRGDHAEHDRSVAGAASASGVMEESVSERGCGGKSLRKDADHAGQSVPTRNFWSSAVAHLCKDGKLRRFESGFRPLADELQGCLGHSGDSGAPGAGGCEAVEEEDLTGVHPLVATVPRKHVFEGDPFSAAYVNATPEGHVMRLKGYGNSITVETAAIFCKSILKG